MDDRLALNIHRRTKVWIPITVLSICFLFLYREVLINLARQWRGMDIYSYGFLVPVISFYLFWVKRKQLARIQVRPSYLCGFLVLLISLFMLLIGNVGGILSLQELTLPLSIAGVVVFLLGFNFLKILWLPIAYLFFMIPIWEEILTGNLHSYFQNFSAQNGAALLKLIGIPAYREGVFITLPNIIFEVARACSGINYLIAVIAISIPLAYLFLKSWVKRIVLICSAILISVLANGVRIGLIGILSYYGIGNTVHGPFHLLQGLFVSAIGYTVLLLGLWTLSKKPSKVLESEKKEDINLKIPINSNKGYFLYPVVFVFLIFIVVGSYLNFYRQPRVPLKIQLNLFPFDIDGWKGRDTSTRIDVFQKSDIDHELTRMYKLDSDNSIGIYIGYFEYQKQGKELINDRTVSLHAYASKRKVSLNPHGAIEINEIIQKAGDRKKVTIFWYDINGCTVSDKYMTELYTIWDGFRRGQTNGAIIMVETDVASNEDISAKLALTESFIKKIYPLIRDHLP